MLVILMVNSHLIYATNWNHNNNNNNNFIYRGLHITFKNW